MSNNRATSITILVKGILMILISVIHTIAIYFGFQDALKNMSEYWAASYALWFGLGGIFFLYIGIIDLMSYAGLKEGSRHPWKTGIISGIFQLLIGGSGTYFYRHEVPPPVFPMIILFLGIVSLGILIVNRHKHSG
jgi:hypothetical protein